MEVISIIMLLIKIVKILIYVLGGLFALILIGLGIQLKREGLNPTLFVALTSITSVLGVVGYKVYLSVGALAL